MRTLLSQFCDEFEGVVRPLLAPLRTATDTLAAASEDVPARQVLPTLRELRHQLEVVTDKVAEQQAYVLIFGPLKSGKSTLMNAMASAYVSEVTSLPAYPCMVFVSHSDERELVTTRYDGDAQSYSDLASLRAALSSAHSDLAERMRAVEARGEAFDPQVHAPGALRRIDVKVPAGDLEDSGAVLVDTPGLYARMKFGYDRMTREFRDTAACAIFVVKSENLFLEQVFEEFCSLLELFSRIFLVVNLDTTKQDLRPDGGLAPSLESKDPQRLVEAFQTLAMTAPLKAAADEGRLRIYPVDLLRAASRRLSGPDGQSALFPDQQQHDGQADFDAFLGDLTDYLNSTDYLVAFLGDSIRRANSLLRDIHATGRHPGVLKLAQQVEDLHAERVRVEDSLAVLERLCATSWNDRVAELRDGVAGQVQRDARALADRTQGALFTAVDAWFQNDASLQSLLEEGLLPCLESYHAELSRLGQTAVADHVERGDAGLVLEEATRADLARTRIQLDSIGRGALIQIDARRGPGAELPPIDPLVIPVRKGFWDWILFRTQTSMRRRLFGQPQPTARIPQAVKARRLGEGARELLRAALEEHLAELAQPALEARVDAVFGQYAEAVQETLRNELNQRTEDNEARRRDVRRRLDEVARVRECLDALEGATAGALEDVSTLNERYGRTDPEVLLEQAAQAEAAEQADEDVDAEADVEVEGDEPPYEVPSQAAAVEDEVELDVEPEGDDPAEPDVELEASDESEGRVV